MLFGHGRSLSSLDPLSAVIPWQNFMDSAFFRITSSEWISIKLYSCNVARAWTLPFGFGQDICSFLPLAEFYRFCNFRDNFSSNQHIPMKLYIYKALRAWMLPFRFRAIICSYLPLVKFHRFCNFRDNLCSNEWISMKLCSCNVVRAWTLLSV